MKRRDVLGALGTTGLAVATGHACGQPAHIKIVLGFAPGGSADVLARHVADIIQTTTGRATIVENRPGASGRLAIEQVKAAPADGDTLLLVPHGPVTLFPHVFKSLRFNMERDFAPVTRVATGDYALTIGPAVPAKDLAGFIQWARTAGDKAAYGSPGSGTLPHLLGVSFARSSGLAMTHVPYRGSAPAMNDLAGGIVAAVFSPVTEAMELHKAGRVHIVATAGSQRSTFLDQVPTFKESKIDLDVPLWFGLYAPAATQQAVLTRLRTTIQPALVAPASTQKLARLGLVPAPISPVDLLRIQTRESQMWAQVVKASGFTPED